MHRISRVLIKLFVVMGLLLLGLIACAVAPEPAAETTTSPTASATLEATASGVAAEDVTEEPLIRTPTPAPTATPEAITQFVEKVVAAAGLAQVTVFTLSVDDWINLAISLVIIFLSLIVIFRFLFWGLKRLTKLTPTRYDNLYLESVRSYLRAFILLLGVQYATRRLLFLDPFLKQFLNQVYFALFVYLTAVAVWKLIDLFEIWYQEKVEAQEDVDARDAALMLTQRFLRSAVIMVALIVVLDRFGINVTALLAALGIGGLAFSLAAQDTLSNMISGIIILTDRPFLVGHRIEIQGVGTWGDVISIGTRSTRIRTRDNRMVIVPNSILSGNQIVNYSYPDPRYRIEMDIAMGYGHPVENVRRLLVETIRSVEGVLPERPVDALYIEMGETAMIFRVRWWIESYVDTRRMFDRVNTALQLALDAAGIENPNRTYDINLKLDSEDLSL